MKASSSLCRRSVIRSKQDEMLELRHAKPGHVVVSGSLSPEMDPTFYDELFDLCHERGAELSGLP